MKVKSTRDFTLSRGAQQCVEDEESCVSGAVVPFCWEEKPGVPLMVSSKYGLEVMKGGRERELGFHGGRGGFMKRELGFHGGGGFMKGERECELGFHGGRGGIMKGGGESELGFHGGGGGIMKGERKRELGFHEGGGSTPTMKAYMDKEKALTPLKHTMLFPLPPPPSSLHNVGVFSSAKHDPKPYTPSPPFSTTTHIKKHRASSFPPFLNKSTTSNHVGKASDTIKDDPFMRAIQACTKECDSDNKSNGELYSKHKSCNHAQAMAMKDAGKTAAKNGRAMKGMADNSYGATKAPLGLLMAEEGSCSKNNGGMDAVKLYEAHPGFMVGSVLQQSAKQKKPAVTCKTGPHHRSASYGWLSCRSADNHDSIVRIYNPRSSHS